MNGRITNDVLVGHAAIGQCNSLKWFVRSAALILVFTGGAKLWTAFGSVRLLTVSDPLLGLSFKHLMLAAGLAELAIAAVCLFVKAQRLATVLVAWLATNFVLYRLGLWWMDWHRPCNCLGNLTDALHISPQAADDIMKVVLAYLLIGSYGILFSHWIARKKLRVECGGLSGDAPSPDTSRFGATGADS